MVSHLGLIYRNDAAQARIDTALAAIAKSGAVDVPPVPEKTRDQKHNETLWLEWTADTLEAVEASGRKPAKSTKAKA